MKIGILTYHSGYNFGANLQAFASSSYLKSLGHEVKIINYGMKKSNEIYQKKVPKEQWIGHENFILQRLPLTDEANNEIELVSIIKNERFDGIIVGADAVWSYPPHLKDIPPYFLKWLFEATELQHIPAAAMSVAHMGRGLKYLDKNRLTDLRGAISNFSYLSVRDRWTQRVINEHLFNGEQRVVILNPDPVVIINDFIKDSWENLGFVKKEEKYIICTFSQYCQHLSKWFNDFKKRANNKGYNVAELPIPEGPSGLHFDFTVPYPIDPIQWYLWLKNACGFVGQRYHAIVSCIASGTPFISIDTYGCSSVFVRAINKFGYYNAAKLFDQRSKIYNLLDCTDFEKNRFHSSLQHVPPEKVLSLLEEFSTDDVNKLQDELNIRYEANMENLIDALQKNK